MSFRWRGRAHSRLGLLPQVAPAAGEGKEKKDVRSLFRDLIHIFFLKQICHSPALECISSQSGKC